MQLAALDTHTWVGRTLLAALLRLGRAPVRLSSKTAFLLDYRKKWCVLSCCCVDESPLLVALRRYPRVQLRWLQLECARQHFWELLDPLHLRRRLSR